MATKLNLVEIQSQLKTKWLGKVPGLNELWPTIDSTNDRLLELARKGTPSGVIVLAEQQTKGRGRLGRTWQSPNNAGLYVSFLLHPNCPKQDIPLYTLALGIGAVQAIQICTGVEVGLKWVNDLIVDGKKLGGILAELVSTPESSSAAVVLGIGINLDFSQVNLPSELEGRVEWLSHLCAEVDVNQLVTELAYQLENLSEQIEHGQKQEILNAWRRYSVTLGKQVRIVLAGGNREGTAIDINENGALIVESTTGERLVLNAGEITIRNLDGSYS